jgi:hypothetical protein
VLSVLTLLVFADVFALVQRGEPVGSAVAAAVRERFAGVARLVVVELGEGGAARPRVHLVPAHIWRG